jgi:predicted phage terminase large subunit-like protein
MMDLTKYRVLLRNYFPAFIQRSFHQLNPNTPFQNNWHIDVIAAAFEECRRGVETRLIVNLPPRNLKSHCASIAFPAWYLGHNPSGRIMCVSYGQDLADKFARECRNVMASFWYKQIFPTRLSAQKHSVEEFLTQQEGYRLATSVGGPLTGKGADTIILDDPLKPEEALSDARRNAVNEWYKNTLYSRLNDKQKGCIIIIMQRLHEDDLVGHLIEQERFRVLSLPAIAESDEEYKIQTIFGKQRFARRAGEVLHAAREPREVLDAIRQRIGEYNFAGQYQQSPAPVGGGLIRADWFKSYADDERPERFDQILQSWDTANKLTELSDYSVCTTWGIKGRRIYLLEVLRKRMEYPDLKRAVHLQARAYRPTVILIEDKASGTQLIQELIADGLRAVTRYKPEHDKVMRLNAQTATIENGFVLLPREAPWLADYLHEITTFPNAKYDDQADSTSQALAWINQRPPEKSHLTVIRRELARQRRREGVPLDQIAKEVRATPEEVQNWLEGDEDGRADGKFANAHAGDTRGLRIMTEAEVDSLVREYMSGCPIACSREEYERRIRPALQEYAAYCLGHGDKVRAGIALKAVEELDSRFNFAA